MRDKKQRCPLFPECLDSRHALVLEIRIADGKRFIDDEEVRTYRGRNTERQTHLHTARVHPNRLIEVRSDFREALDIGIAAAISARSESNSCPAMNPFLPPVNYER